MLDTICKQSYADNLSSVILWENLYPYRVITVRQVYLATIMNFEFELFEDSRETEIPQPLPIAPLPVPPSDDPYLITEEFEASKPSDTRITSSHSTTPSDSTTPLSPNHPLAQTSPAPTRVSYYCSTARMAVRTRPTLSSGMSDRIAKAAALSPSSFYTSELVEDTKDESSNSDTEGEGSEDKGPGSEDEDPGLEDKGLGSEKEEEAAPEGQQEAISVVDTAADKPLGLGYGALRRRELALGEGSMPSTFEIDRVLVSPSSPAVPTLVASPMTTPTTTIAVDEDEFLKVGAQLEIYGSILHDHTHRLDALPPTLFEGYDMDLRELYTRSKEVRDEIFSQRYRLRSLEQEYERATVTFGAIWRLVLALESWAGHVDAQRAEMQ
ncbi:hypothetical protein Tco_0665362 [Tanacetum coccineum]